MSAIARVRNKQIDTGKIINILVQAENNAEEILFHIEGEPELVTDFASLAFYLLYTRPGDTVPSIVLLEDASVEDDVIKVPFVPTSYFTANDGTVKIQLLISDIEVNLSVNDDGTIDGSTLWQTFPAFLFVASSQLNATETIIEENVLTKYLSGVTAQALKTEGFAVGEQNGVPVESDSEYHKNNAKYYKNLAKDWAMKTGGPVEGVEMSAKVYAASSQNYATESQQWANKMDGKVLGIDYSAKYYAGEASDSATAAGLSADSAAASAGIVSDHATAIDAIYADLLNIDVVATDIQDDDSVIDAVAQNIANVNAVAGNESNINAVNSNKTNIDTVAGSISNVGTVAGNISNVNAVAGNTANINAVKTNESNINTVAGISSNVTTVAGIASDVTAVAGIASDVSAVEDIKTDVSAVAAIDTDVSAVSAIKDDVSAVATIDDDVTTVATDISDVSTVASDITKVTAVADDLTNIDAVADDLTNIDNAVNYALEAEGWAVGEQNGVPVTSGSPYYENNAKYYGQEIPNLKAAIRKDEARITNLEEKADPTGAYKTVNYRGDNAVPTGKAKYALVESIVGKSRAWNNLCVNGNFDDTNNWDNYTTRGTLSASSNILTFTVSEIVSASFANRFGQALTLPQGHEVLIVIEFNPPKSGAYYVRLEGSSYPSTSFNATAGAWNTLAVKLTAPASMTKVMFGFDSGSLGYAVNDTIQFRKARFRDLTLIFPEGVPSTVAECVQKCPDLLKYDAYGTSIVDTTVEGVRSINRNRINPTDLTTGKWLDSSTGNLQDDASRNATVDYLSCSPNVSYYFGLFDGNVSAGNDYAMSVAWYDINKSFVSGKHYGTNNHTVTAPNNAFFFRIGTTQPTYDVIVNVSDANDGTFTPYMTDTLTLPTSVTLRSAGSVADTDELNVEVLVDGQKVNRRRQTIRTSEEFNLTQIAWTYSSPYYQGAKPSNANANGQMTSSKYKVFDNFSAFINASNTEKSIFLGETYIFVKNEDESPNGTIVYALATESVTLLDPIENNTIKTEGGGTIETIQTQTPVIDNSMDVGYLAL